MKLTLPAWLLHWTILQDNLCQTHPRSSHGFMACTRATTFSKRFSSPDGET
jgi:hypothetical protein